MISLPTERFKLSSALGSTDRASSEDMGKAFWIGLLGGFFGFLGGLLGLLEGALSVIMYSTAGQSFTFGQGFSLFEVAFAAFVFSIIGVIGGIFENRKFFGGSLMLLAAFGILFSASLFGILAFLFFLVGSILIFARKTKHQAVVQQPPTASWKAPSAIEPLDPASLQQYRTLDYVITSPSSERSRGYKVCGVCGKRLAINSKYCDQCGTTIT
jgi:hypothetical protein